MFFNKDYYKSSKAFSAHVKQYEELMEYVMPHLDKVIEETSAQSGYIAKTKLAYYKALKKTGRSNVMPPSAYNSTIHEMGHFLDDTVFGKKYRADKFDMAQSYAEYAGGLSAYATANRQEYVAESFTAWWFGETDKIDPKLVKYFEESVKDGQSNHL